MKNSFTNRLGYNKYIITGNNETDKQAFIEPLQESICEPSLSYHQIADISAMLHFGVCNLDDTYLNETLIYQMTQLAITVETQILFAVDEIKSLFTRNEILGLSETVMGFVFSSMNPVFSDCRCNKSMLKFCVEDNDIHNYISQLYKFDLSQLLNKIDTLTEFQSFAIFMAGKDGLLLSE